MNIHKTKIVPALYNVSTPIGNLGDISKRQQEILSGSDYFMCEDTRVTSKLLNFLNIKKKLISYHSFNEKNKTDNLINDLKEYKILSLVSDAGTHHRPMARKWHQYLVAASNSGRRLFQ